MERVHHDGRETAYLHARPGADGERVLYVHGSGGTHQVWGRQYEAATGPTVGVDLSGHGRSTDFTRPAGEPALGAYVADVQAVARQTEPAVLVGNSLGGAVVLEVLRSGGYDPAGVVLAGSGAKLAVAAQYRRALDEDFEAAVELLHRPNRLFHEPDPELLERSKAAMRSVGQEVTRRDFLTAHAFDIRGVLEGIETQALAVVGEHDQLTPPWYHEYLAERLPACERAVIADAAHLAMLEQPRAFSAAIEAFLERL